MQKEMDAQMAMTGQQPGPMDALQKTAQGKMPKRIKKQLEAYKTVISKLLHSKETRKGTMQMLQTGPPEMSVSRAALTINEKAEEVMKKKGINLSDDVKMAGALFLVDDLITLGNGGADWPDPVDEQEATAILQDTLQDYIQAGLKKGTIDPIELQQNAEGLLSPEQKEMGMQAAKQGGVPMEPNQQQILGNQKGVLTSKEQASQGVEGPAGRVAGGGQ